MADDNDNLISVEPDEDNPTPQEPSYPRITFPLPKAAPTGLNPVLAYSATNTTFLTPTQVGFFVIPYDGVSQICIVDWTEGTS